MKKKKVLMTLDEDTIRLIDLIAVTEDLNRSKLVRLAISEWLEKYNINNKVWDVAKEIQPSFSLSMKVKDNEEILQLNKTNDINNSGKGDWLRTHNSSRLNNNKLRYDNIEEDWETLRAKELSVRDLMILDNEKVSKTIPWAEDDRDQEWAWLIRTVQDDSEAIKDWETVVWQGGESDTELHAYVNDFPIW